MSDFRLEVVYIGERRISGTVSKTLERTRKNLKVYLTERGFEL